MNWSLAAVSEYYDLNQRFYSNGWSKQYLHYGYWSSDTRTLEQAIELQNREVYDLLDLQPTDVVLDAGCGVGGNAITFSAQSRAQVVGVTISLVQFALAQRAAASQGVTDRVSFDFQDYSRTSFPDAMFSKIYGVESICHAEDKRSFIQEVHRLLTPGGLFVMSDAFLRTRGLGPRQKRLLDSWREGWVCPDIPTVAEYRTMLADAGFENIEYIDRSLAVLPSADRIVGLKRVGRPLVELLGLLRIYPRSVILNYRACILQKAVLRTVLGYGNLRATKKR